MGPKSNDQDLLHKGHPVKMEAEIAVTSHKPGMPLESGGDKKQNLPRASEREHGPAHTLVLDFWPPELGKNTFLLS